MSPPDQLDSLPQLPTQDAARALFDLATRLQSGELTGLYIVALRQDGGVENRRLGNAPPLPIFWPD